MQLKRLPLSSERGAVIVLAALMLPLLTVLTALVIESGWWWTHHKHLQAQADAAALAGASGPWLPGCNDNPSDPRSIVGKSLQYSGDTNRGALYNPQYTNSSNVHSVVNSANYSGQGGADNTATGGSPCASLNYFSGATCQPQSQTPTCPNLDVKITEASLPTFFGSIPGLTSVNESAHARVEIQAAEQETGVRPVAVRDDSAYQCAAVRLAPVDGSTPGSWISLGPPSKHNPNQGDSDPTSYTQFQGSANVQLPSTALSEYVQVALYGNRDPNTGQCLGASDVFPQDSSGNTVGGVNFINVYSTAGPGSLGNPPALGSVAVTGNCAPDSYFSSTVYWQPTPPPDPCGVTVTAGVTFPAGASNCRVTIGGTTVGPDCSRTVWTATDTIGSQSGPHQYTIGWSYVHQGSHSGTFQNAPQQQSYSGTSDDTANSSSDGLDMVHVACTANCGPSGDPNSYPKNSTPTLSFTVRVAGLANSRPQDPPMVLRYAVANSKRTGIVDCWDNNNSASNVYNAIVSGCPRPIYLWSSGNCGPPPPNAAPDTAAMPQPIDCVGVVPGNKRGQVKQALMDRIGTACDNWQAWKASNGTLQGFPPVGDPRAMTMIITPPADLSGNGGSTADIPVVQLATFYITGADGLKKPASSCPSPTDTNEPFPGTGSSNSSFWGHWIKYVPPGGIGKGKGCNKDLFGDCVAVLTQ